MCITLFRALLISICIISSSPVLSCTCNTAQHTISQSQTSTPWILPKGCRPKAPKESPPQRTCQLSNYPLRIPPARSGSYKQPTQAAWYMRRSSESYLMREVNTQPILQSLWLTAQQTGYAIGWTELLQRCSRASSYCSGARDMHVQLCVMQQG